MKFIQQFTTGDWEQPLHRLIVIEEDGTRLVGSWTGYQHAATVNDPRMPFNGWISYTDYYEGVMPRVSRFESVDGLDADGGDMVTKDEVPQSEWLNDTAAVPDIDKCEVAQEVSDMDCAKDEEFCFRESDNKPCSTE